MMNLVNHLPYPQLVYRHHYMYICVMHCVHLYIVEFSIVYINTLLLSTRLSHIPIFLTHAHKGYAPHWCTYRNFMFYNEYISKPNYCFTLVISFWNPSPIVQVSSPPNFH